MHLLFNADHEKDPDRKSRVEIICSLDHHVPVCRLVCASETIAYSLSAEFSITIGRDIKA